MTDFVHLHNHSHYSLLDGMSTPEEIASIVSSNGQIAAAITDHGSMAGGLAFQKACEQQDIKSIIGVEAYWVPRIEDDTEDKNAERFHLILLAKNNDGLTRLNHVQQRSWTRGFYYKPRMDYEDLEYLKDGVICLSGCMAGYLARLIEQDRSDDAEAVAKKFSKIFGDDYYIELQPWNALTLNDSLIRIAGSLGLPVVGTIDCHYPTEQDRGYEEALLMMGQMPSLKAGAKRHAIEHVEQAKATNDLVEKMNIMYPDRFLRFEEIGVYLHDSENVVKLFQRAGINREDIFSNSIEIADKCNAKFQLGMYLLPKFSEEDSLEKLKILAFDGLKELGKYDEPVYQERLVEELGVIGELDFADYFLIVWDICRYADSMGFARGAGRGSVGGSLLAYCLGITKVDPIKYDLLFARFINKERINFPDIDLDFEDKHRDDIKAYAKERWGEENVAGISTFSKFQPKGLVKKIGSLFRVPYHEMNSISPRMEALEDLNSFSEGRRFASEWPEAIPLARRLDGRINASGAHAGGVVIADRPLWQVIPIESRKEAKKDSRIEVTAFDMNEAEDVGLWKFDFLSVKALSVIHDCIDKIKELYNKDVESESLSLDDPEVFKQFNDDSMVGIFQAEGAGYKDLLSDMPIDNFDDLAASNALVRPGAWVTQGKNFLDVKYGKKQPNYYHECLEPILKDTYGGIIYQEQVMQMAVALADFSWYEADILRKIIGKKRDAAEFLPFKEKFIHNASEKITTQEAQELWDALEAAAMYQFNKSHAVAYSMHTYQTMWLKHYYPKEFLWACLTNEDKAEDIGTFLLEADRLGLSILPPDINLSDIHFSIDPKGIRFGLSNIAFCGKSAIEEIIKNRPFHSYEEFRNKCQKRKVKANLVENLEKIGAFKSVGHDSGYDEKKYYLPILNCAIYAEDDPLYSDQICKMEAVDTETKEVHLVKGRVKSHKRMPNYFRVELEDSSGELALFANDKLADIKSKDYILALIDGKNLFIHANALEIDKSDPFIQHLDGKVLPDKRLLEYTDFEKRVGYVLSTRWFKTRKGMDMGNVLLWYPEYEEYENLTVFNNLYGKARGIAEPWSWVMVKRKVNDYGPIMSDIISSDQFLNLKTEV